LTIDRASRPQAHQLLKHKWLKTRYRIDPFLSDPSQEMFLQELRNYDPREDMNNPTENSVGSLITRKKSRIGAASTLSDVSSFADGEETAEGDASLRTGRKKEDTDSDWSATDTVSILYRAEPRHSKSKTKKGANEKASNSMKNSGLKEFEKPLPEVIPRTDIAQPSELSTVNDLRAISTLSQMSTLTMTDTSTACHQLKRTSSSQNSSKKRPKQQKPNRSFGAYEEDDDTDKSLQSSNDTTLSHSSIDESELPPQHSTQLMHRSLLQNFSQLSTKGKRGLNYLKSKHLKLSKTFATPCLFNVMVLVESPVSSNAHDSVFEPAQLDSNSSSSGTRNTLPEDYRPRYDCDATISDFNESDCERTEERLSMYRRRPEDEADFGSNRKERQKMMENTKRSKELEREKEKLREREKGKEKINQREKVKEKEVVEEIEKAKENVKEKGKEKGNGNGMGKEKEKEKEVVKEKEKEGEKEKKEKEVVKEKKEKEVVKEKKEKGEKGKERCDEGGNKKEENKEKIGVVDIVSQSE
jgi:hypothetical protein